ncbi:MAG: hypothetical protein KGR25_05855, partial [Chloroflexi bacterium]|nr:hypothetical protein [Chloroflexota bacterium]
DSVTVTATFTEAVALQGTPSLTLVPETYAGGTLPSVSLASAGNALRYAGTFTVPAGNGSVTATVNAADTAGNALNATGQTGFIVDNLAPVAALTYSLDATTFVTALDRTVREGDTVTIRATFTEADQLDTAPPTITFTQDGNVTVPDPQPMSATSDRNVWTYDYIIPNVQNGTVYSTVAATDRAGNASASASAPAFTIVNDLIPPKILSIVRADSAEQLTTGATAPSFTVTFDEDVTATVAAFQVVAGNGIGGAAPTIASVSGSGPTWTVTLGLSGTTGDYGSDTAARASTLGLTVKTIGNERVQDRAQNPIGDASVQNGGPNDTYYLDNTAPTIQSVVAVSGGSVSRTTTGLASYAPDDVAASLGLTRATTSLAYLVTFTEPVSGVTPSTFGVNTGAGVGGSPAVTTVASADNNVGKVYRVTVDISGVTADGGTDPAAGAIDLKVASTSGVQERAATGNVMSSTVIPPTTGAKHVLDNIGPTASITYSPARPVKANEALTITATFSETLASAPTISLGTPNALTATPMQASGTGGKVWTFQPAIGTGNGQVAVTLSGSDEAGNPIGSVTGASFTVDNTGPSVTIGYQSVADTESPLPVIGYSPSLAEPVRDTRRVAFQVVATDVAAITGSPTVVVVPSLNGTANTGEVTTVTVQEATGATGTRVWRGSYDVPHGTVANDGIANVTLGIGGIKDVAGNDATSTGQSLTFVIDSTPPTVTIGYQSIADGTPPPDSGYLSSLAVPVRGDRSVAIQVTVAEAGGFSGAVSGAPVVSVQPAGPTPPVPVTLTQTATGSKIWRGVYDAPANGSNGGATVRLVSTGVTDEAGNVATVGAPQATTFEVDNIRPSAAIRFHRLAKGGPIPTTTYEYDDTLATPVNGTQDLAIEVEVTEIGGGGTVTGAPSLAITANGITTPVTLTETAAGSKLWRGRYADIPLYLDHTATIDLAVSGIADQAGNVAEVASGSVLTFGVDNIEPGVTVTYRIGATGDFVSAPRAVRGADGTMTVKATFTNTGSLGGTPTIQLAPGTFAFDTAPQPMTATSDPLVWTYPIPVPSTGDGAITATVRGRDPTGNVVTDTHQALTVDNSVPTVDRIERAGGSSVLTDATGPAFTVTFLEPVQSVTTSSFAVVAGAGTTGTAPAVASVTGGPAIWTVTLGSLGGLPGGLSGDYANGTRPNASLGLTVVAAGVTDRAGNPLSAAVPDTNEKYFIDRVAPTFAVTYSRPGPLKAGPLTITATS